MPLLLYTRSGAKANPVCGRNRYLWNYPQISADALYLHRNSVQYRLDRLRDKTGYDFRKPRNAFLLYLASPENEQ